VAAVEVQINLCPTDVKQLEIIEVQFNESHTGNTTLYFTRTDTHSDCVEKHWSGTEMYNAM